MRKRATTPGNVDIMKLKLHAPKIRDLVGDLSRLFGKPSLDNASELLEVLDNIIQEAGSLRKVAERVRASHAEGLKNKTFQNMHEYKNWMDSGMDMPETFRNKIEEPEELHEMYIPRAKEPVIASKKESSTLKVAGLDHIYLGPTPCDEDCAQVGDENYSKKVREELSRYRQLLEHKFGTPPAGAAFKQKRELHSFGPYYEMTVAFDPTNPEATAFAFFVEENAPLKWSDTEKLSFNFEEGHGDAR